jgi:hypothetical protein
VWGGSVRGGRAGFHKGPASEHTRAGRPDVRITVTNTSNCSQT